MSNRLEKQSTEWIDRSQPIDFSFEGSKYRGYHGDTLTSALWANGVRMLGRSFKYHRPRGSYSLAGHDANVIVEDGTRTNLRGDLLPIEQGLTIRAVNTLGGLQKDRYRWTERLSRFMPVGFYYKAFHTPRRLFRFYEEQMRKVAGLGRINTKFPAPASPKDYDFCELLVVGAGPAGLSAAISAVEAGVDVLLVDDQPKLGGSLCWQRPDANEKLQDLVNRANRLDNLRIRTNTQTAGCYADHWVALVDAKRLTKLRARSILFATGAIEQPAVFQNNDLPGVILASAAQRLIHQYAVKPFERAVVLTANEDGYRAALDLIKAGVRVSAVVDLRINVQSTSLAELLAAHEVKIHFGYAVTKAVAHSDQQRLDSVIVSKINERGEPISSDSRTISCDGLAVSVGWMPNANLLAQAGARFKYDTATEQLLPTTVPNGVFVAGRLNGLFQLDDKIADGQRAGLSAAKYLGHSVTIPETVVHTGAPPSHPYPIFAGDGKKNFVDFDEDLHLVDFVHAHQEGYDNIELMKRYSTVGMGPSQGKVANMNAVRILARLNNKSIDETGTTTGRPFYQPVSIGHLAGRRFHPHRHTPLDAWHRQHNAEMSPASPWSRPECYRDGSRSRDETILNEARNVRQRVGLIDISTLTKIQVNGPDAVALLELMYAGRFAKQQIGTVRYAIACDDSGILVEEGVVGRIAEDRFYITASTAHGALFYQEMQRFVIQKRFNVTLVNVTGHWGAMNLAGPNARSILRGNTDIDLNSDACPTGAIRVGKVNGATAIVMRTGFVGELSYEIHLPASQCTPTWNALMLSGKGFGIAPFGTEAQRLLRLEKGHLIGGHDTDALTTPFEAQLDKLVKMDKPYFVGKRSLQIMMRRPLERVLVGIAFESGYSGPLPEECHLVIHDGKIVGRVTSIAKRSTLGYAIGLAFVHPSLKAPGTRLEIRTTGKKIATANVACLPFYDRENQRQA